jgi:hypothetical protein
MVIKNIKNMNQRFVLIMLFLLSLNVNRSNAQMNFPNGNTLNLKTNSSVLYLETRILFTTGKYLSSDYKWEKVLDSLDSRWFFSSCFNGDCKNDLLQSGQFIKDFGINDTTCFMAFHVDCNEKIGSSVIKYNIINTKNLLDFATLTFNISYSPSSGLVSTNKKNNFMIYPNPTSDFINISSESKDEYNIEILDLNGQTLDRFHSKSQFFSTSLQKEKYKNGLYLLRILNNENSQVYKITIE